MFGPYSLFFPYLILIRSLFGSYSGLIPCFSYLILIRALFPTAPLYTYLIPLPWSYIRFSLYLDSPYVVLSKLPPYANSYSRLSTLYQRVFGLIVSTVISTHMPSTGTSCCGLAQCGRLPGSRPARSRRNSRSPRSGRSSERSCSRAQTWHAGRLSAQRAFCAQAQCRVDHERRRHGPRAEV